MAELVLLERDQLEVLFSDGLRFSIEGPRGPMRFDYNGDGTWDVVNPKGGTAFGTWRYEKRKICRDETGKRGGWDGLQRKQICFAIKMEGSQLYLGGKSLPLSLEDESVLARLQQPAGSYPGTSGIAAERALELKRLELERERLALEKEKLHRERLLLEREREQTVVNMAISRAVPDVQFGDYHALVIGINDYKSLPKLKTALTDARAVARTLESKYGYVVHLLENPTRIDIIDKLDTMREKLTENDNLLIYYAGHGWLDPQSGRGYWLPVNAETDRRARWFSNSDLTDAMQALFAKHVMVVADSCYSGTLTRSIKPSNRTPDFIERMAKKRTRVVLSSGGLEPVVDSGGGKHSLFAAQFLRALNENQAILDGTRLFEIVRKNVVLNAEQTPQYSDIRRAGHEGGDFLFVRRK